MSRAVFGVVSSSVVVAGRFTPACILNECEAEAKAVANDAYSRSFLSCADENFKPCAGDLWACLGDEKCEAALKCIPQALETCSGDIWNMITDPQEREKITCLTSCFKDGKIDYSCAILKCGKAAADCISDATCLHAVECAPKALTACSGHAFDCVFGNDPICKENLQCVNHGISQCSSPTVNLMTDTKIADFVTCAGTKCPRATAPANQTVEQLAAHSALSEPSDTVHQLLCMAEKCNTEALVVLKDDDTNNLVHCAVSSDPEHLCSSAWECLGDASCAQSLQCWSAPLKTCSQSVWHALTNPTERKRIEHVAGCFADCKKQNGDDVVGLTFCGLDNCGADLLDCWKDESCKDAVACLPQAAESCGMATLDAYLQHEQLRNSVKCLVHGAQACGAGAVAMIQDQNVASAVKCSGQCTRTPQQSPLGEVPVIV